MVLNTARIGQRITLAITLLMGLALPLSAAEVVVDKTQQLTAAELLQALKKGGHIIYMRHAVTEKVGEKEVTDSMLDNCVTQRNLSEAGRRVAEEIGGAIKKGNIPIGKVLTSPYCRCVDTAMLAFGKAEKSPTLHFAIHLGKAERAAVTKKLVAMLKEAPGAGTNNVLVSHTANLKEAVNIWPEQEGEAEIFKPDGAGNIAYLGKILPQEWSLYVD